MNKNLLPVLAAALAFGLAACDKQTETATQTAAPAPAAAPAEIMPAAAANPALLSPEKATEKAPEVFKVKFTTTKGDMLVEVRRAWSPLGADRIYNLVKIGFFDGTAFFRVMPGFMAQIGIHGDPAVSAKWRSANLMDDPKGVESNKPGTVTFATCGPNCRSTQIFFNMGNNSFLDPQGFTPFGKIVEGADVPAKLNGEYGDGAVDQGSFQYQGNAYVKANFPNLDYIKTARLVP